MTSDQWLDRAYFALHTVLIAFNLVGWAWRRTQVLHLVVLSLTVFSWVALGAFYGWGYCPCTDWHFQVRRRLGFEVPESSFIQLLASETLGLRIGHRTSDLLAVGTLGAIVIATAATWAMAWRRRPASAPAAE